MSGIYPRADSKYLWMWYQDNSGSVVRESTGETTKTAAREVLRLRESQVVDHRFPGLQAERTTLEDLFALIRRDYKNNKNRTLPTLEHIICRLRKHFGNPRAIDMPFMIGGFVDAWQARGLENSYINRHLSALRRMFNLAHDHEPPLVARVPKIKALTENNVRTGYYEHDTYLRHKSVLPDYLQIALIITYLSGVRKEECLSLERTSVNFTTGFVQLAPLKTKTKEPRGFCLRGQFYAEILQWEQKTRELYPNCKYVVHHNGERLTDFRSAWDTSLLKIGLVIRYKCKDCGKTTERTQGMQREGMACRHCNGKRLRRDDQIFHDLRRTAVRNMIDAGVSEKDAMYISGHKTRSMLDRYKIVSRENLEVAADKTLAYLKKQEEAYRSQG